MVNAYVCGAHTRMYEQVSKHAEELRGDATTLAVAGDSAGGNLAAAVALKARGHSIDGPSIRFECLICPVIIVLNVYKKNSCQGGGLIVLLLHSVEL